MARLTYSGDRLREIAFPLGGIGTGTIGLGGRGQLRDFDVANRPAKGQAPFRNFFALGVDDGTGTPQARVLERRLFPPYTGHRGPSVHLLPGLPRFAEVELVGEYPPVGRPAGAGAGRRRGALDGLRRLRRTACLLEGTVNRR